MNPRRRFEPDLQPITPRDRVCVSVAVHAISLANERERLSILLADWDAAHAAARASLFAVWNASRRIVLSQQAHCRLALARHDLRTSSKYIDSLHERRAISDDEWGRAQHIVQAVLDELTNAKNEPEENE